MRESLRKAEARLARLESGLLVAMVAFMAAMAFIQVARRQFFGSGALWVEICLRRLVLWVAFLGAALAAADDKHFAWEAAANRGGNKMKAASHAAAAVITGFLANASIFFFREEYAAGKILFSVGPVPVPEWLFALAIPTGFILVMFHTSLRALNAALDTK